MKLQDVRLPGDRLVACTHPAEVRLLMRQVAPYFKHGIELADGDIVVDVGANIGLFCAQANGWGVRRLRGLAIEPVPAVHAALTQNLARHARDVKAVCTAVSDGEGTVRFQYFPRATMLSTAYGDALTSAGTQHAVAEQLGHVPVVGPWLARAPQGLRRALVGVGMRLWLRPRTLTCPTRTLSSLWREHGLVRIDLLKVDAERAEMDVLRGIEPEHWPLIRQVVMEVHDVDGRLAAVQALLRQQGLDAQITEQSAALRPFGVHQLWALRQVPSSAFRRT